MTHQPSARYAVFLLAALAAPAGAQPRDAGAIQTAPVVIAAGAVEAAPGADVTVPIALKGVKAVGGVRGVSMRLGFDPAVLTFKSAERGPAVAQSHLAADSDPAADPGKVGVGFVCTFKSPTSKDIAAVEDDGVVLHVVFAVNPDAPPGAKSVLTVDNFRVIDAGAPPFELGAKAEPGEVAVRTPARPFPLLWVLIGAGAVLLLLFLAILLGRRGRRDEPRPAARGAVPRFTPEGAATFAHACRKCGGVIQLPRAMRGEAFQCGACGTTQTAGG